MIFDCLPVTSTSRMRCEDVWPEMVVATWPFLHLFSNDKLSFSRPDPHPRGAAQQPDSLQEQDEEILGSDDEEQEDPNDYCKGKSFVLIVLGEINVYSESISYAYIVL